MTFRLRLPSLKSAHCSHGTCSLDKQKTVLQPLPQTRAQDLSSCPLEHIFFPGDGKKKLNTLVTLEVIIQRKIELDNRGYPRKRCFTANERNNCSLQIRRTRLISKRERKRFGVEGFLPMNHDNHGKNKPLKGTL